MAEKKQSKANIGRELDESEIVAISESELDTILEAADITDAPIADIEVDYSPPPSIPIPDSSEADADQGKPHAGFFDEGEEDDRITLENSGIEDGELSEDGSGLRPSEERNWGDEDDEEEESFVILSDKVYEESSRDSDFDFEDGEMISEEDFIAGGGMPELELARDQADRNEESGAAAGRSDESIVEVSGNSLDALFEEDDEPLPSEEEFSSGESFSDIEPLSDEDFSKTEPLSDEEFSETELPSDEDFPETAKLPGEEQIDSEDTLAPAETQPLIADTEDDLDSYIIDDRLAPPVETPSAGVQPAGIQENIDDIIDLEPHDGLALGDEDVGFAEEEIILAPAEELIMDSPSSTPIGFEDDQKLDEAEEDLLAPDSISQMRDEVVDEMPDMQFGPTGGETEPESDAGGEKQGNALHDDMRKVLGYLDNLFDELPEERVKEFAHSEYYGLYNRLFKELGL
jgi:hypothetical protein